MSTNTWSQTIKIKSTGMWWFLVLTIKMFNSKEAENEGLFDVIFFFYQMCFNSNSESTTSRSLKTFSANRRRQTWVMCSRLWIVDYQVHCCMQVFILLAVLFFEFSDDACVHNVTQLTEPNRKAPQVVFFFSPASCTWNKEKTHNVKLKTLKILTTEKVIIVSVTVTQGKINR